MRIPLRELARRGLLLCLFAILALLPSFTSDRAILNWAFLVLLYAALAQSWNLLGGFAGQVNLGHAAFFGLGLFIWGLVSTLSGRDLEDK